MSWIAFTTATAHAVGGDCLGTADDPHASGGAGGVIFKTRLACSGVSEEGVLLKLWLCPVDPPKNNKPWLENNCQLKGYVNKQFYNPTNGVTYTFYTPDLPSTGAHGVGYWYGDSFWCNWNSPYVCINTHQTFSAHAPFICAK